MNLKDMRESIQAFFLDSADKTAAATKFVRRKSKLTGNLFLQMPVFGFLQNPKSSLNDLSGFSEEHLDLSISSQGIDERISDSSLSFVKAVFNNALNIFRLSCRIPVFLIEQFSAVNITDSTGISLPEALSDEYPGSGGSASEAALKLQLIFDFLTGCFKTVTLTDGITPDQRYKKHIETAEPNSLNLFDLGYFAIEHLKGFAAEGAYFLCRLLQGAGLYMHDGAKVNLPHLLKSEIRDRFESELYPGKTLLKCRVCCFRVAEEIAGHRRSKAVKQAAKKGRTPGKESPELANRTISVTNVPVSMLLPEHIALLYSVRRQTGLIFKLWKSHTAIHKISGFRKERILTELYAKLIGLVLFQYVAMPLRNKNIDLSPTKIFKRFIRRIEPSVDALHNLKRLSEEIDRICSAMLKFGKREKRKSRFSSCQKLLMELYNYS